MMMEFPNTVCYLDLLDSELKSSSVAAKYSSSSKLGTSLFINFSSALTEQEETDVNNLVSNHAQNFANSTDYQFLVTKNSQQANINFGQNLLHDWMRKNTLEGMTVAQSLWVFARFETFTITMPWGSSHVDLFKMFYAGAIPTVYYCILRVVPDDMTESYHWLNQTRLDWVKEKLEEHLGAGMVAYIQSLD